VEFWHEWNRWLLRHFLGIARSKRCKASLNALPLVFKQDDRDRLIECSARPRQAEPSVNLSDCALRCRAVQDVPKLPLACFAFVRQKDGMRSAYTEISDEVTLGRRKSARGARLEMRNAFLPTPC
jgi:hypothetical protein